MASDCTALIIFGVTGDLARKKIFGVLYDLAVLGRPDMAVIGVGRSQWSREKLRTVASEAIRAAHDEPGALDEALLATVLNRLDYVQGAYDSPDLYRALAGSAHGHTQVLCYLAVPPTVFATIVEGLAETDLAPCVRLLIEKPFGSDLASAKALKARIDTHFDESQTFAVDHYLEKESLQNLMVLRFANRWLEPAWNAGHIESVSVTMAENFGIEGRAGFFDSNGTLRDVVQNHGLQIVTALAMEPPASASAADVNDRRSQLLGAVATLKPDEVVFGQYDGYRDVEGVNQDSNTETYVRAQLRIDNDRWRAVAWTLIAGKALAETSTEIVVKFKAASAPSFIAEDCQPEANCLRITMAPVEAVALTLQARSASLALGTAAAELVTDGGYRSIERADAYARLFDDARRGDHTGFTRADVVEQSWRVINDLIDRTQPPTIYPQGSWGPTNRAGSGKGQ